MRICSSAVLIAVLCLAAMALTACRSVGQPGDTAGAATSAAPATVVSLFNPTFITPGKDQVPVNGICDQSPVLPRPGAYHCTTEAGADLDLCFFLVEGGNLGCGPDPIALTYRAIVTATNELPEIDSEEDPIPFYVDLGPQKPACEKRVPPPFELDGKPVTFSCAAPGAWIVGPLRTDTSAWEADYVVTDSNHTAVTYGPEATFVVQAWQY
jgi:hypothetical protein